jgi:fructose-1,6-bisphosphatase I
MDVQPKDIHDRVPVILGSKNEVTKVVAMFGDYIPKK